MPVKAILFDNDGILVDTEHIYYETTKEVLANVNFNLTIDMFIEYFLRQGIGVWHLLEGQLSQDQLKSMREQRNNNYYNKLLSEYYVIPGVESTISRLAEQYRLCIVTSCRQQHFNAIHNNSNLLKYFEFCLTREDYKDSKPSPEPYLTAVNKLGLSKDDCIIIEDSERGLKSAINAGIRCCVIPNGYTLDGNFSGANKILNNIIELPQYLERL